MPSHKASVLTLVIAIGLVATAKADTCTFPFTYAVKDGFHLTVCGTFTVDTLGEVCTTISRRADCYDANKSCASWKSGNEIVRRLPLTSFQRMLRAGSERRMIAMQMHSVGIDHDRTSFRLAALGTPPST